MISVFQNKKYVALIFFSVLLFDLVIKFYSETSVFRFITKPLLVLILMLYTLINRKYTFIQNLVYVLLGLAFFGAGDIFMILYKEPKMYSLGILCFILGKIFYIFRLVTSEDFKLRKLMPYILFSFIYMVSIFALIYKGLNGIDLYLIIIYFLIALHVVFFSIIRKNSVNRLSYHLVFIGVFFSIISESITALTSFYYFTNNMLTDIGIMLFYGLSQYFFITGFVEEKKLGKRVV